MELNKGTIGQDIVKSILETDDSGIDQIVTKSPGPQGRVPITEEMLRDSPSGNLFAYSQNAGMGWSPAALNGKQFLILSTQGGIRESDGQPLDEQGAAFDAGRAGPQREERRNRRLRERATGHRVA